MDPSSITTSDAEFAHILSLLIVPNNQIRKEAEALFNKAKKERPLYVAQGLLRQIQTNPDSGCRTLCAVILRRIFSPPMKIKSGRGEERQEILFGEDVFEMLSQPDRIVLLNTTLDILLKEKTPEVLRGIVHLIAVLASRVSMEKGEWPELLPKLLDMTTNTSSRSIALTAIEQVIEHSPAIAPIYMRTIGERVGSILLSASDASVRDKVMAGKCLLMLMVALSDAEHLKPFEQAIPLIVGVMPAGIQNGEESTVRDALDNFAILAEEHPKFLKPHLDLLAQAMNHLATNTQIEKNTRSLALEFLVTLAERAPAMIRKNALISSTCIPVCMTMIADDLDTTQTLQEWEEEENESTFADGNEDEEIVGAAEAAIDRFSRALKGKSVIGTLDGQIAAFLQSDDWRKRRTGLIAISLMGEGCGMTMYNKLKKVVPVVMPFFQDPHQRVRYAAIHVIGQLTLDFSDSETKCNGKPNFQNLFHEIVLPALSDSMEPKFQNNQHPQPWRVRAHAASSLINFCSGENAIKPEFILPFLEKLLRSLAEMIEHGPLYAKQEAIVALAMVAGVVDDKFTPYYAHFVPGLIHILTSNNQQQTNSSSDEESAKIITLKAKAMECLGLIAVAVGKEKFLPDSGAICQLLMNNLTSSNSDEIKQYALMSLQRISSCMEEHFVPYFEHILPLLLEHAQKDIQMKSVDGISGNGEDLTPEQKQEFEGMHLLTLQKGTTSHTIIMDSNALQLVSNASRAFFEFAQGLGVHIVRFIPAILPVLIPMIRFEYLVQVRITASLTIPRLLDALSEANKTAGMNNVQLIRQAQALVDAALPKLLESLYHDCAIEGKIQDIETTLIIAETATQVLRTCMESGGATDFDADGDKLVENNPPQFGVPPTEEAIANILKMILASFNARIVARFGPNAPPLPDDDDEEGQEERYTEESLELELQTLFVDMIGFVIKAHGQRSIPAFMAEVAPVANLLLSQDNPSLTHAAVCMFDDVLQHGYPASIEAGIPQMCMSALIHNVEPENRSSDLLQASSYGVGILASKGGPAFTPHVDEAIRRCIQLAQVLQQSKKNEAVIEALGVGADNAVMALYYLIQHRKSPSSSSSLENNKNSPTAELQQALLQKWLSFLPIVNDAIEARSCTSILVSHILNQDKILLGGNNEHVPKILSILAQSYPVGFDEVTRSWDEDEQLLTEKTRSKFGNFLRTSSSFLNSVISQLSDSEKQILTFASQHP